MNTSYNMMTIKNKYCDNKQLQHDRQYDTQYWYIVVGYYGCLVTLGCQLKELQVFLNDRLHRSLRS